MLHEKPIAAGAAVPLFVDVDGTLTRADISLESFIRFIRTGPFAMFQLLFWLLRGRALAKTMVARRCPADARALPYRPEVLALIARAAREGRPVILASASHWRNISRVAAHLGLTGGIIASRKNWNAKGRAKLAAIRAAVGVDGAFDYAGDSKADICLWHAARRGWSANFVPGIATVEPICIPRRSFARTVLRAIRPRQWTKNGLVFVPALTSGLFSHVPVMLAAVVATLLMSLIASAIYLVNDLLDIEADRAHKSKYRRPIAHGDLSIPAALLLAVALGLTGLVGGALLGGAPLLLSLLAYMVLTTAYSVRVKAVMVADVIMLAALYTLRIWVGAIAISVALTFWLLLFSIFLFLSLAYLKRYMEMKDAIDPHKLLNGRGYVASDLDIVMMSGVSAGMVAILVLALFANDMARAHSYATPQLLWLLCLPLLYWINRIWMMARRGEVEGDPVAFATKDPRSIAVAAAMGGIFLVAQQVTIRL